MKRTEVKNTITFSLDDVVNRLDDRQFDLFLDFLSELATGRIDLQEISYEVVGINSLKDLLVEVRGYLEDEE
jgi:hypothetical protein